MISNSFKQDVIKILKDTITLVEASTDEDTYIMLIGLTAFIATEFNVLSYDIYSKENNDVNQTQTLVTEVVESSCMKRPSN